MKTFICYKSIVLLWLFLHASAAFSQTEWTHVANEPVFDYGAAGQWDAGAVFMPAVIQDGDTLKMWYVGSKGAFPFATIQIGLATSTDGISWMKYNDTTTTTIEFSQSDPVLQVGDSTQWDEQASVNRNLILSSNFLQLVA